MTMTIRWASLTHAGAVRKQNQDALVDEPPVFAVADGMGGHAAGDIASQIAVRHLNAFAGAAAVDVESAMAALRSANAEILYRSRNEPELAGMGTTVAGVALSRNPDGDAVLVFNAGDSRVYLARQSGLVQISADHSVVAELVAAEEITEAEARVHPQRNVVTRGLGLEDDVHIDTWLMGPDDTSRRFLICSDGLTNEIEDSELLRVLSADQAPEAIAEELLELALGRGARDNVSIVVLDVDAQRSQFKASDGDTLRRSQVVAAAQPEPAPGLIAGVPTFPGGTA